MTKRAEMADERGAITTAVMVIALAVLAAAGLAVDGGRKLNALAEARDLADNAARVGAQEIDLDTYRLTGAPVLDPVRAVAEAQAYLATTGNTGAISVDAETITVTVTLDVDPKLLPIDTTVSATESATAQAAVSGG